MPLGGNSSTTTTTAADDIGEQTGTVAFDVDSYYMVTMSVGAAGITDLNPSGLDDSEGVLIRIDNTSGNSVAIPLSNCPGTAYSLGEIPTSGIFDVYLSADGDDWYMTIGNDWETV